MSDTTPATPIHPGWSESPATRVPAPTDPTSFGDTLKAVLTTADRSQAWLARQIDCDHTSVHRIAAGHRQVSMMFLARIVRVFPADRDRLIAAALADADRRRAR